MKSRLLQMLSWTKLISSQGQSCRCLYQATRSPWKLVKNGSPFRGDPMKACLPALEFECGFRTISLLNSKQVYPTQSLSMVKGSKTSPVSVSIKDKQDVCTEHKETADSDVNKPVATDIVGKKQHTCDICGKSFSRTSKLKIHMNTHTGERPYKCDVCGKGFLTADNLKRHSYVHGGERPYQCVECGKGFVTPQELQRHKSCHLPERPYKCEVCGKGFKLFCHLHNHMTVHSDEKKFVCDVCDMRFKYKISLKKHKERVHDGDIIKVEV